MYDVVVLGAGVAGLTAAWLLHEAGLDVHVAEARDRFGGRTWSPEVAGKPTDMGATWVWEHETAVHALLAELGCETFAAEAPEFTAHEDLYEEGGQVRRARLPRSTSPERRITGGTQALARALAERVPSVALGSAARAIEAHGDHVLVQFDHASVSARHVIAALPPSLIGSSIRLVGAQDAVLELLPRTPVWMGDMAKIVAIYDRPFWRDAGLSGRAFSHTGPMVEVHDLSGPAADTFALFGFFPRPPALQFDVEEEALLQWVRLFGQEAAFPLAIRAHVWWAEPETSPVAPVPVHPRLLGHEVLRRPLLGGRLHLASTETAAVNAGHIDGAVSRAREVVRDLLRAQ